MLTAKKFIESTELLVKFDNTQNCILEEELPHLFIEFAKLHVKEALKAADNNAEVIVVDYEDDFGFIKPPKPIWGVCSDSILNAYHLDLIK